MNIFVGIKIFVDIFFGGGVIPILDYILGVISLHFRVFFKAKVQNGNIFLAARISNFLGCLKFLIFFFFGGGGER